MENNIYTIRFLTIFVLILLFIYILRIILQKKKSNDTDCECGQVDFDKLNQNDHKPNE